MDLSDMRIVEHGNKSNKLRFGNVFLTCNGTLHIVWKDRQHDQSMKDIGITWQDVLVSGSIRVNDKTHLTNDGVWWRSPPGMDRGELSWETTSYLQEVIEQEVLRRMKL